VFLIQYNVIVLGVQAIFKNKCLVYMDMRRGGGVGKIDLEVYVEKFGLAGWFSYI
jgi:hypothetical protein